MGQQIRKVTKRRRRKLYLKRKKELAKTNAVLGNKSAKTESAPKPAAKKVAKKAAKKAAKKVAKPVESEAEAPAEATSEEAGE